MVAVAVLIVVGLLVLVALPRYRLTGPRILLAAVAVFLLRAGGVWLGRSILKSTGGPWQIPAYLLVMLGWPEITVPAMLGWTGSREHALIMATGLLAITSTVLGLVVYTRRRKG